MPARTASAAGTPPFAQALRHPRAPPFSWAMPRAALTRYPARVAAVPTTKNAIINASPGTPSPAVIAVPMTTAETAPGPVRSYAADDADLQPWPAQSPERAPGLP